jgi:hypothetical protein
MTSLALRDVLGVFGCSIDVSYRPASCIVGGEAGWGAANSQRKKVFGEVLWVDIRKISNEMLSGNLY